MELQSYAKKQFDVRPFNQIWNILSRDERRELIHKLELKGIPEVSLYRWLKTTRPHPTNQKTLVSILKKLNYNTTPQTLFP